ncbi:MAG: hypothetical protein ACYC6L_08030 [Anaerolineae bacterium]
MPTKRFTMGTLLVLTALLVSTAGCAQANPDEAQTRALAVAFVKAVFVQGDAALAMSMTNGVNAYGFVSEQAVASTIAEDKAKLCVTDPNTVEAGTPASD